ncbi:TMF family protein [Spirosoma aureum]|uniref:TMF family protein n=2 Tax=Spirosoma aureum TaxID=2692134 RepID=A0A6G9AZP4_9BACT|nr:TMF family protein [Spirosoma aureum]
MIGDSAGLNNTVSSQVMIGSKAGFKNTTGVDNTFVGAQSGYYNTTGSSNLFVGNLSGYSNLTGTANTFLGAYAGIGNKAGINNVFTGNMAGYNNTNGNDNTFVGNTAGYSNSTGQNNVYIGSSAGASSLTASQNTFIGVQAGVNATAGINTFVGASAGKTTTTGQSNTFVGVQAGQSNTTGSSNLMMGVNAGAANTTGSANFFVGDNAGGNNTSGGYNVYLGTNAGNGRGVNGDNNVSVGGESGRGNNGGINNTFLGFRADAGAIGLSNATAIGTNTKVTQSNSVILGDQANVGIGTTAPANKLHIVGGIANTAGIRLPLTSANAAGTNASKFLTVNSNGDVILATYASGARQEAEEALWQRNGSFLQSTQGEAIIIGQGVNKTPLDYNLFVSKGILTEKVKVAVRNTTDWSDYVFTPTYQLIPLSEVECYISQYKHLPGILSASEMVEQGNDLHQTDAKLLAKIEELTLYSIQLEKANKQQAEELQVVKQKQAELEQLLNQILNKK